jgi:hypothetical protein
MVEMVCNGKPGLGCPFKARLLFPTGTKREARVMAVARGWDYTREFGLRGNWEYLDLCTSCKKRKR